MIPVYIQDLNYTAKMALHFLGLHLGNCIGLYKNEDGELFAQFASSNELYMYNIKTERFEKH